MCTWIENWLHEWVQTVVINDPFSEVSGVSVLGTMLFNLFNNDIEVKFRSSISVHADDTKIMQEKKFST